MDVKVPVERDLLVAMLERWNGNTNERAMTDALEFTLMNIEEILRTTPPAELSAERVREIAAKWMIPRSLETPSYQVSCEEAINEAMREKP
jgi:hypothetical protein